jgi:hypothetical protein
MVTDGLRLAAKGPRLVLVFQEGVAELPKQTWDVAYREVPTQEVHDTLWYSPGKNGQSLCRLTGEESVSETSGGLREIGRTRVGLREGESGCCSCFEAAY